MGATNDRLLRLAVRDQQRRVDEAWLAYRLAVVELCRLLVTLGPEGCVRPVEGVADLSNRPDV